MISKKKLKFLIDETESKYERCWQTLRLMRHSKSIKGRGQAVLDFQPLLCGALLELEKMRLAISNEKKCLITRKQSISPSWIRRRRRNLSSYQESIKECISIGKSLGDSFAWIFYRNDKELLLEHLKHEEVFHLPTGIGGIGELKFLETVKHIGRQLIIYHGTTTFLRLGDVSLVDIKSLTVTAIGELKTKKLDKNKLGITLRIVGPDLEKTLSLLKSQKRKAYSGNKTATHRNTRLWKQTIAMNRAFAKKEEPCIGDMEVESNLNIKPMEQLVKRSKTGKFNYNKADDGLLLMAYKQRNKTLSTKILNSSKLEIKDNHKDIEAHIVEILSGEAANNLTPEFFHYASSSKPYLMSGMIPLFWWPIDLDVVRQIIFQDIYVFTIFNYAHLLRKFEDLGFQFSVDAKTRRLKGWKKFGKNRLEFINIEYFFSLTQHYLFSENSIVDIIKKWLLSIEKANISPNSRVDFQIFQEIC